MPDYPLVRAAKAADALLLAQIARDSYAVYIPAMGASPAPMLEDYAARIAEDSVYVLEKSGRICGYIVLLAYDASTLLIDNIAIDTDFQNQGLGKILMDFAESEAVKHGQRAIVLYTNEAMAANLSWYPRLGYKEICRKIEKGYKRVYFRKEL